MRAKITNEIIDERLLKANSSAKRIGNYIPNLKIEWLCLNNNCGFVWLAYVDNIIYRGAGCPKCAGNVRWTNERVDERLKNKLIKRLEDVAYSDEPIFWQCLKQECNCIWKTAINCIMHKNSGCPRCSKCEKLDNNKVDNRLSDRSIKRLSNYINYFEPMKFKCLNCLIIWTAISGSVITSKSGCPLCKNKNEKMIFKLFNDTNIIFEYQKNIKLINKLENKRYLIDFYIPNKKIAIEYNGRQHYQPVQFGGITKEQAENNFINQIKRDEYIKLFCESNNIKLIEIDGRSYYKNNLKKYIREELIPILNK